jgi:ABC-2 type transport system permease protein
MLGDDKMKGFNSKIADAVSENFAVNREEVLRGMEQGDYGLGQLKSAGKTSDAAAKTDKKAAAGDVFSQILRIETEQVAGKEAKNPMAARLVGGYAIMFLLFAISGSTSSLFEDKKSGIFTRLLSGPVTKAHILWSKFLFGMTLGLVQISTLFLMGHLLYDLELMKHLVPLLVVSLCASAACTSFGMLLVSITKSAEAANGLATLLVLTMSAIGGAWFPVSFMPEFIQKISRLTVVYWSMEGFSAVLWAGQGLVQVLPIIGVLLGIASVVMAFSLWRFNRGSLFD